MSYFAKKIEGIPYARNREPMTSTWKNAVIAQTSDLPSVVEACALRVTFLLPPNKFPPDCPFGPDLDNLLKPFLDALNETIFRNARGMDSCIISLEVMKTRVASDLEAGARIELLPVSVL